MVSVVVVVVGVVVGADFPVVVVVVVIGVFVVVVVAVIMPLLSENVIFAIRNRLTGGPTYVVTSKIILRHRSGACILKN